MDWGQVGLGALGLAGSAVGGAIIGSATAPACTGDESPSMSLICGPGEGAAVGASGGLLVGGVGGLLLAALKPKYKTAGLSAAAIVGGVIVLGAVQSRL